MSNSDRRYTPYQQLQNPLMYQHQQQHIGQTYNQLGRPQGQLGQPMMQPQQQSYTLSNIKTEPSSPKEIHLFLTTHQRWLKAQVCILNN